MSHQPPSEVQQERAEPRAWEICLVEQQHTYLVNSLEDPQVAVDLAINQPVEITPLYAAPQPETPKQPDSGSFHVVSPVPSEGPKTALTDTERLDWLEQNHETVYRCTHTERRPSTMPGKRFDEHGVFDGWAVRVDQEPCPSPRAAIDAAILAAAKG